MNKRHLIRYMFRNENQQVSRLLPTNLYEVSYIDSYKCRAINNPFSIAPLVNEHEVKHNIKFLSEGLIKTYPTNKFITWFKGKIKNDLPKELTKLKFSDIEQTNDNTILIDTIDFTPLINEVSGSISFIIPFYKSDMFKPFLDNIVNSAYIFGYDLTSVNKYDHNLRYDIDVFIIQFEARFSNYKFELADTLLHVSPLKAFEKIKKHGIVPKSKSSEFKYMDRVYLFNKCSQSIVIDYGEYKMTQENDIGFCVFKIFKDKLISDSQFKNGKLEFFVDTTFSDKIDLDVDAIFTYNNIGLHLLDDYCVIFDKGNIKNPKAIKFK